MEAAAGNAHAPIRVLIADDHRLFAEALDAILSGERAIEVVGRARNGAEAVEIALELEPDVVLMDISMPVMDGIEATRRIRESRRDVCVLMLTGSNAAVDVDRSREAGASGYVTKVSVSVSLSNVPLSNAPRSTHLAPRAMRPACENADTQRR
jgi:DNA-binding NarL/FixJ family response regulator